MGLEMPHLKADPSEDPVGRSLRKPWVKLWIQNVPRFLSLKKWYPKFMKPNSAPLATTFWRHPADLTSTARQCRHNLPHFVGFRYRAIVGVPVSTPTKEPDSLLQCPCLQTDLSGIPRCHYSKWILDLVPQNREGESTLGVAHISRCMLQHASCSCRWTGYQSPVFPGVYTQSVIHYLVYGKPKWKHGPAIVLMLQDLVHKLWKGELSFLFSGTSCLSEDLNLILLSPCKFTLFHWWCLILEGKLPGGSDFTKLRLGSSRRLNRTPPARRRVVATIAPLSWVSNPQQAVCRGRLHRFHHVWYTLGRHRKCALTGWMKFYMYIYI